MKKKTMHPTVKKWFKDLKAIVDTSVFRLIAITLSVLLPLCLLTLLLSNYVVQDVQRRIPVESENTLRIYMAQMDKGIENISSQMTRLAVQDLNFRILSDKDFDEEDGTYLLIQNMIELQLAMRRVLEGNSMVSNCFAYFPEKEIMLFAGSSREDARLREAIEDIVLSDTALEYRKGRMTDEDNRVLLCMAPYRKGWFGWWLETESLLEWFEPGGGIYLLSDLSGNIRYSIHEEMESIRIGSETMSYGGEEFFVSRALSKQAEFSLVQLIPQRGISAALPAAIRALQLLSFLALFVIPGIMLSIKRWMISPIKKLTFVENSIKHTLSPGSVVHISVKARKEKENRVNIRIEDTGCGIPDEVLKKIEEFRKTKLFSRELGIGIQNSIDRLDLLYGDAASLQIFRGEKGGTIVEIQIPFWEEVPIKDEYYSGG